MNTEVDPSGYHNDDEYGNEAVDGLIVESSLSSIVEDKSSKQLIQKDLKNPDSGSTGTSGKSDEGDVEDKNNASHLPPDIDIKYVNHMFYILFFTNFVVNMDNGFLPACTTMMMEELGLTTEKFGTLGSIVYVGQTIGCVTSSYMLQRMNEKVVLPIVLVFNLVCLIWFTTNKSFVSLILARMLTGLFQESTGVYFPVWVDTYASETKNATWMSIIMIGSTVGNIFGYILAACLQDELGWRGPFYIQATALFIVVMAYVATPSKYIQLREQKPRILAHQGKEVLRNDFTFMQGVWRVLQNTAFLRMCFSATFLYFVVTGVQFWFSDFMIQVQGLKKEYVFIIFGLVSTTGPVCGVIAGGILSSKLGGYNSKKSLYVMAAIGTVAAVAAFPVALFPSNMIVIQVFLLWVVLFCGGNVMPSVTGVMLNTVPENLKTTANSISNTCYNIFGFLPSPYIYGAISDIGGVGKNMRTSMFVNMMMATAAAIPGVYQSMLVYYRERRQQANAASNISRDNLIQTQINN